MQLLCLPLALVRIEVEQHNYEHFARALSSRPSSPIPPDPPSPGPLFEFTVRLGDPDFFFFQSTPFALKLRGHFINISMMILAKGI